MINFRRKEPPMLPFTVIALRQDEPLIRIGVIARSEADAISTARELFPSHLVTAASLAPEWEDSPA